MKSWREHTKLVSQPLLPVGPAHYKDPSELSFYSEPSLRAGFPPSLSWLCAGTEWQYHSGWGTQSPCSPWHPEVTSLLSCGLNTSFLKERSNETFVRTRCSTGTVRWHIWHSVFGLSLIYHNKALVITAVLSRSKMMHKFHIVCKPHGSIPVLLQRQNPCATVAFIWTTELHIQKTNLSLYTQKERACILSISPIKCAGQVFALSLTWKQKHVELRSSQDQKCSQNSRMGHSNVHCDPEGPGQHTPHLEDKLRFLSPNC